MHLHCLFITALRLVMDSFLVTRAKIKCKDHRYELEINTILLQMLRYISIIINLYFYSIEVRINDMREHLSLLFKCFVVENDNVWVLTVDN